MRFYLLFKWQSGEVSKNDFFSVLFDRKQLLLIFPRTMPCLYNPYFLYTDLIEDVGHQMKHIQAGIFLCLKEVIARWKMRGQLQHWFQPQNAQKLFPTANKWKVEKDGKIGVYDILHCGQFLSSLFRLAEHYHEDDVKNWDFCLGAFHIWRGRIYDAQSEVFLTTQDHPSLKLIKWMNAVCDDCQ